MDNIEELRLIINNWEIIKALLEKPQSPIELVEKIDQSLARISQRLKILEAYGIVSWNKTNEKEVGKPRKVYSINKEALFILDLFQGMGNISRITTNKEVVSLIRALSYHHKNSIILTHFLLENNKLFHSDVIAIINLDSMIELLIICKNPEQVKQGISNEEIRKIYNMDSKVFCYKLTEIIEGIKKGDLHFIGLVKVAIPLYDPNNYIQKLREMINNE